MGIATVAVHSTADAQALHVRFADEAVCIGPPAASQSYLNIPAILSAAEVTRADAIHPGYGFLSENAEFAEVCRNCNIHFIGPSPEAIRLMGNKVRAREAMVKAGLPLLPGSTGVIAAATALERVAEAEAQASFGSPDMFVERYVEHPRHIEIQIAADTGGTVIHLGERECSVQRRHQKLIEESPSPALDAAQRTKIGKLAAKAIEGVGYSTVGTLEFLLDERGDFYFMEMNTRIQVEHPVTEAVTGVDLVTLQIRLAAGQKLDLAQKNVKFTGHAIECRVNAEDPVSFAPSPGRITGYHVPGGLGVRVDSGIYEQYVVQPHYDSLLAKLIVHADDRPAALQRMRRALGEFVVEGIRTNVPFHRSVLSNADFCAGKYDTRLVERILAGESGRAHAG